MRKVGLEPTRYNYHKILSLARLPIPTFPHILFLLPELTALTTKTTISDDSVSVNKIFRFCLFFSNKNIRSD